VYTNIHIGSESPYQGYSSAPIAQINGFETNKCLYENVHAESHGDVVESSGASGIPIQGMRKQFQNFKLQRELILFPLNNF